MSDNLMWHTEPRALKDLKPYPHNPRRISKEAFAKLKQSLQEDGYHARLVVDVDNVIVGGHQRLKAMQELGLTEVEVLVPSRKLTPEEFDRINVRDNLPFGDFDMDILANRFDPDTLVEWGMPEEWLPKAEGYGAPDETQKGSMATKWGAPPFSVLDTKQAYWQERKDYWLAMGIKSELGRDGKLIDYGGLGTGNDWDTSIFDPVLCELMYRWFSQAGGVVLDPFAGGSVRGVVASKLGRQYVGMELRKEQVEANRMQGEELCAEPMPVWHCGDSAHIGVTCKGVEADMVFSCPPYGDLEVYSDDPADISNMGYPAFKTVYTDIINRTCKLLKDNRFAVFVVGEIRDKKGNYQNFIGDTIKAFEAAGLHYYNEAILCTAIGSLPLRVGKAFAASRKLGKAHQNVLVFVKGDAKKATEKCGGVEIE